MIPVIVILNIAAVHLLLSERDAHHYLKCYFKQVIHIHQNVPSNHSCAEHTKYNKKKTGASLISHRKSKRSRKSQKNESRIELFIRFKNTTIKQNDHQTTQQTQSAKKANRIDYKETNVIFII